MKFGKKQALVSFPKTLNNTRPSNSCYFDALWKTHSCMFYPNCTRNHPITYTNQYALGWICRSEIVAKIFASNPYTDFQLFVTCFKLHLNNYIDSKFNLINAKNKIAQLQAGK
jgi:hypothetical protein